jgi:toxin ParE1/3/4
MKYRLSRRAETDIFFILRNTRKQFGPAQVLAYAEIINRGLARLTDACALPAGVDRSDIDTGVKSYHLELAAKKRGGASHILYFKEIDAGGAPELVVLRVLHEAMEPRRRLMIALREEEGET